MHHRPASPPLTARITGWGLLLLGLLRVRTGRLVRAGVVTAAVTGLVLILPVVSGVGSGSQSMVLDSSSWNTASPSPEVGSAGGSYGGEGAAEEGSPVVMGVDGRPIASSSVPGTDPAATTAETADTAPRTTDAAPAVTPETADAPDASAPETSAGGSAAPADPSTQSPARTSSAGPSSDSSAPERPAPSPPTPAPSEEPEEPADDDAEDELLELLDDARGDCDELDDDSALSATARAHSAAMRDAGLLTPLEGGPAGSVARGGTDAEDVLSGWLDDPAGRATILDCDRNSVGIGIVDGPGGPWWTLLLA